MIRSRVSLVAAVAANGVIGRDGRLPWRLRSDLERFRDLTMGHHVLLGRRTFERLGSSLPGRMVVVLSRDPAFAPPGVRVAHSLAQALASDDEELFVAGGGDIFRQTIDLADRLHLTQVHADVEGDARFPAVDPRRWLELSRQDHPADDRNDFPFSFVVYERR